MRTKVTLVLLFLNAALFLYIFRFERNWRTERDAEDVRQRVLGSEAADIRTLEVSADGAVRFRIERRGGRWLLTEPLVWPADPTAVNHLLTDLQFLKHVTSFAVRDAVKNGLSLSSYGLDRPKLTVTFTSGGPDTSGSEPTTTTLKLGDTARGGQRLYLLSSDGQRIHVVGREFADDLLIPVQQLRSDAVFTIPIFEASSLTLQAAGVRVHINRQGALWSFDTPIQARADKVATEVAINKLDGLDVKAFVPADPQVLPSADPQLRATIEGNDRTETLLIGQPVPASGVPEPGSADQTDYYAQFEEGETVRPAVFVVAVPNKLMKTLLNARVDLREPRFMEFDPDTVTTITLAAPNRPEIALQRLEGTAGGPDGGWQILVRSGPAAGTQAYSADRAAVEQLLGRLARLSAERFQSDAPLPAELENWGFNRPEREVTLALAPAPQGAAAQTPAPTNPLDLQLGLPTGPGSEVYARLTDAPSEIYTVNPDILAELPVDPLAWRERKLRQLPDDAVTGVRLEDLSTGALVASWKEGAGEKPAAAIRALIAGLRTLSASRFTAGRFSERAEVPGGESRPWRYEVDADLSLPGGSGGRTRSVTTLLLTERLAGDLQIAGSREFNVQFAIEQPLVDALWKLTYGARDQAPAPSGETGGGK